MKDGIRVFLPDDLEKIIKREADAEHVSPGEYISMMVKEGLSSLPTKDDFEMDAEEELFQGMDRSNQVNVHLYGEDANQIKRKAADMGLNPTAYIRRLIYTKEYVNIVLPTDDIQEYIEKFSELEKAFVSVVGYIRSADGVIFKQDLELLNDYMGQIQELFKLQVKVSVSSRLKVENKMIKYVRDQIKKNRVK